MSLPWTRLIHSQHSACGGAHTPGALCNKYSSLLHGLLLLVLLRPLPRLLFVCVMGKDEGGEQGSLRRVLTHSFQLGLIKAHFHPFVRRVFLDQAGFLQVLVPPDHHDLFRSRVPLLRAFPSHLTHGGQLDVCPGRDGVRVEGNIGGGGDGGVTARRCPSSLSPLSSCLSGGDGDGVALLPCRPTP